MDGANLPDVLISGQYVAPQSRVDSEINLAKFFVDFPRTEFDAVFMTSVSHEKCSYIDNDARLYFD